MTMKPGVISRSVPRLISSFFFTRVAGTGPYEHDNDSGTATAARPFETQGSKTAGRGWFGRDRLMAPLWDPGQASWAQIQLEPLLISGFSPPGARLLVDGGMPRPWDSLPLARQGAGRTTA
ncbi:hypothetical protein [Amycolatopsis sp. BJA-103]|uniref:hypothetical protein n=1 Tax=Amycolatopsis sp. BJA-103 TaxID=1911175 RepID=UPI0011AF6559|nr:hypothetical protein [Amycolatopsis sp. BJA-103]